MKDGDWWDTSWNPVDGCSPADPETGCKHCWAAGMAQRFWGDRPFSEIRFHPQRMQQPCYWKKPRRIFACSMGDLFHANALAYSQYHRESQLMLDVKTVIQVVAACQQHTFLVLTKRPENAFIALELIEASKELNEWFNKGAPVSWPLPNLWLGTSVSNQAEADERIPILVKVPAAVRFVSIEPMLSSVDLRLRREKPCGHSGCFAHQLHPCEGCGYQAGKLPLDWVIVGAESGPGARPMHPDWVRNVRDQCVAAGLPFWLKSLGQGKGRLLDGRTWNEVPK